MRFNDRAVRLVYGTADEILKGITKVDPAARMCYYAALNLCTIQTRESAGIQRRDNIRRAKYNQTVTFRQSQTYRPVSRSSAPFAQRKWGNLCLSYISLSCRVNDSRSKSRLQMFSLRKSKQTSISPLSNRNLKFNAYRSKITVENVYKYIYYSIIYYLISTSLVKWIKFKTYKMHRELFEVYKKI